MRLGSSWIRALGFIILEETCDFEFVAPMALSSGCKTLAKVGDRAIDANASHEICVIIAWLKTFGMYS